MHYIKTTYNKEGFSRTKTGVCPVCGKRASRTKEFYQTINPWNKDENGNPKTGSKIMEECRIKCEQWVKKPVVHAKCESQYKAMKGEM